MEHLLVPTLSHRLIDVECLVIDRIKMKRLAPFMRSFDHMRFEVVGEYVDRNEFAGARGI